VVTFAGIVGKTCRRGLFRMARRVL
jgi:hypothetical protein